MEGVVVVVVCVSFVRVTRRRYNYSKTNEPREVNVFSSYVWVMKASRFVNADNFFFVFTATHSEQFFLSNAAAFGPFLLIKRVKCFLSSRFSSPIFVCLFVYAPRASVFAKKKSNQYKGWTLQSRPARVFVSVGHPFSFSR